MPPARRRTPQSAGARSAPSSPRTPRNSAASPRGCTRSSRLDYDRWPFYRRLTLARRAGRLGVYCLGVGVDPVTFAADILTVAVFDAAEFDAAFGRLVTLNAEGRVITTGGQAEGIPFTADTVTRLSGGGEPVQASGAALLQLAWRHRRQLLG